MIRPTYTMLIPTLLLIVTDVLSVESSYCWREYTGSIPEDAVTGGKDIDGKDTYIGQVYIRNGGLTPAQIYTGVNEVYAPYDGVNMVDKYIKILCGPQENFYWLPANASHLHLILLDKHAVFGGHDDGGGRLNIGRICYDGETKIGKVASFKLENAAFYFNNQGEEEHVNSFEVLMYNNVEFDDRMVSAT